MTMSKCGKEKSLQIACVRTAFGGFISENN